MKTEAKPMLDPKFAWCQVPKAEAPKRSATERVGDFLEIYSFLDEDTARQQAMRCIQCPEPTCVEGCPLNNRIPEWMALTAEGRFMEAAQVLQATSCMEEVFSRLCAHPCEARCILEARGEAVAINAIERFLNDYAHARGLTDVALPPLTGFKAAVMNAGPCGLSCAFDLARHGHAITVFDHRPEIGGLLAHGIPAFKMEADVLRLRIEMLEKLGVQFRLGAKPGLAPSLKELRASFDAVFFGAAVGQVKTLEVPGADLRGVHQGLAFIMQKNLGAAIEGARIEVKGRRVVVLGGGDVAMDCLRTALRGGARDVLCLYRRDAAHLPANQFEYENAREEGARFDFRASPVALLGDEQGRVAGVRCVRNALASPEPDGRPRPVPEPGTEFVVPADVVLVALGFVSMPFPTDGDLAEVPLTASGLVVVDENLMTPLPGVFAGGTLVRGAGAFLDAVRDARKAARAIDHYLLGRMKRLVAA
ncbi:MAG: NAD(P)-dependent oxidoreductase [Verrucomicrobia bacterium]|nr:NAD(P)-dependent oxidoreductase [Verrucomicrobiota bacterium]